MIEKTYNTPSGDIHYWVNEQKNKSSVQLVFLPGLTVDHRLFDKQVEAFEDKYSIFVWDAPSHALSYPFEYDYDLAVH
jgi:pimeloyl-ACP methyl ester carboxylesterase